MPPPGQHREAEIAALLDTQYFIDRARGALRLRQFRLRHRRLDLRGGGPRRPRRSGADRAVRHVLLVWIEGHRRAYRGAGPPVRPRAEADVLPPGFPRGAWAAYRAETGLAEDARSTPTPSCAGPMPAPWPTASRSTRRWRRTGASPSRPTETSPRARAEDFDRADRRALEARLEARAMSPALPKGDAPMPIKIPATCPPSTCCARGRDGDVRGRGRPAGHPPAADRASEPDAEEDPDREPVRPPDRRHAAADRAAR
jgi:hypothetical protein